MIDPGESSLIGQWLADGPHVVADATCRRIEALVASHLIELSRSSDGWSTLFQDPVDGRLWEHTYPHSEWHGGGPPSLRCITLAEARASYGLVPER